MRYLALLLAMHLQPVSPPSPNRQPQLAAANGVVALVFGSGDSIWLARSTDNGANFNAPAKVADLPKMLLGRHRGPRVAISGNSIVVTAIAGDLYSWRSINGGRTWSRPLVVNDRPEAAREGLNALAADDSGHLALAWLDDRTPGGKRLYGAFSKDGGISWGKNVLLYESPSGTICQCCAPSLAALGNGEFAVMWRNVVDGSRDLYTMRIRDGKPDGAPQKSGTGTWKLDACPMDGGGLAYRDGTLMAAWRRDRDVYIDEPGKPELKVGTGTDVAFALSPQGPYIVWTTPQGIQAQVPTSRFPVRLSESGAFPAIVALPNGGLLAAWEENGAISVHQF
jgi:hypothetical protein